MDYELCFSEGNFQVRDKILKLLKKNHVFLTGGAGVGKSYLSREIIKEYKKNSKEVVILGSTGISAVGIGGQTVHSFFGFGICSNIDELVVQDRKNRQKIKEIKKILQSCDLIVIDEISMISANLLDMIRYRVENSSFEGSFLFVGDFFQLPPIVQRDNSLLGGGVYAFESVAWEVFDPVKVELFEMKRTKDKRFFQMLGRIRVGELDSEVLEYLINLCKNSFILESEPTFLYGRNFEANETNIKKLSKHPQKEVSVKAKLDLHKKRVSKNRVQSWINSLPVEEELRLKVGVPILFTSNRWGKFANGERGVLKEIGDDYLIVEKNGREIRVQKQDFDLIEYKADDNEGIKEVSLATVSQYPLKLAYAITIHKSQGMSIENLVCNIDRIFTKSQFYVAIGRAIEPKKLYIQHNKPNIQNHFKNIIKSDERVKTFYGL